MSKLKTGLHYPLALDAMPPNWKVGYVGDFTDEIQPGFACGKHNKEGAGIPHIRPFNIDRQGKLDLSEIKSVAPDSDAKRLRTDDVLFNNTNSPELIGKTAVIASAGDWGFSNHMTRIRLKNDVAPKFAAYQLHFLWMTGYFLHNCVKHVNQASVSSKTLAKAVPFVAPPLDQQQRIVAEIEKQFSRLDEAVANLKRVKANLKRYKAAVLKAAVEGRIVETEAELAHREGRSYETGAQLLQRILETRRSQWKGKGKYKEPAAPDTTDLPELPEGWVWVSVDQLVAHLTDGDHQPPPQTEEGIPFLVIGNVRNGEIDFSDTRYVGEAYYKSLDPFRQPKKGDLLYTLVGSYGIPVRVKSDAPFCIQRHMAILRPHENSPMGYLTLAMASDNVFRQASAVATGTAQKTVPLAGLRRIAIPLPPLEEQKRIVSEADRRLTIVGEVEKQADSNFMRTDRLRQSILEAAFSGRLVPEGAIGEPASELIARIRSATDAAEVTKAPIVRTAEAIVKEVIVADILEALKDAGDWITAQDAFRRCGVADGTDTDTIERLYSELRDYIRPGIIKVERRGEEDWLRFAKNPGA